MHNLTDKTCPLIGNACLLKGCTLFNERLDGCEISILNYNLYQVKEHTRINAKDFFKQLKMDRMLYRAL